MLLSQSSTPVVTPTSPSGSAPDMQILCQPSLDSDPLLPTSPTSAMTTQPHLSGPSISDVIKAFSEVFKLNGNKCNYEL